VRKGGDIVTERYPPFVR